MNNTAIKQKAINLFLAVVLFLSTCTPYFLDYDNPVDPKAPSYKGWTVVATVDDVTADFPIKGSTVVFCEFKASEIYSGGADLYGLQLATGADGFDASFYENLIFTTNVMDASDSELYEGTWYYRVRAHTTNGDWGVWSEAVSFTMSSGIDSSDISPADGGSTSDTTPLFDWEDVDGTASYEVEFADSGEGLDGSDIRSAGESEYQIPDTEVFTIGDTCYWRIRQVNEDGVSGAWSAVFVFSVSLLDQVFVPGGTFSMGSKDGDSYEKPVHSVTVSDFYIGTYEVTQGLYEEVTGSNPASGHGTGDNYPVYYVSWYGAVDFCNALSNSEGLDRCYTVDGTSVTCDITQNGYRLPTEAEWEFAAQGGNDSEVYTYTGSAMVDDVAWYISNSGSSTHEAGAKAANELGIYDMSGNVWEWCWDWYDSEYYSDSVGATDPEGPASGSNRIIRGGGWGSYADNCRVANRDYISPGYSYIYYGGIGFRVVRRP